MTTLPAELLPIFENFITCEYASLTKSGHPITTPVTPYVGERGTIDVSTGLVYPAKAERARRNPKVALLFSHSTGSGLNQPAHVLVIGRAAVRDADLQANMDRYVRVSMRKLPEMTSGSPKWLIKQQRWYFARIWIEVTPIRMYIWDQGNTNQPPRVWETETPASYPQSDPPPEGLPPPPWKQAYTDWRAGAQDAIKAFGLPVLTYVGVDGFPYPIRTCGIMLTDEGFMLDLPAALPAEWKQEGAACLTFHLHPEHFTGQQNMMFAGVIRLDPKPNKARFIVERRIVDWSGGGTGFLGKLRAAMSFLNAGRVLTPRLEREAARRGQPVPTIHL